MSHDAKSACEVVLLQDLMDWPCISFQNRFNQHTGNRSGFVITLQKYSVEFDVGDTKDIYCWLPTCSHELNVSMPVMWNFVLDCNRFLDDHDRDSPKEVWDRFPKLHGRSGHFALVGTSCLAYGEQMAQLSIRVNRRTWYGIPYSVKWYPLVRVSALRQVLDALQVIKPD